MNDEAVVLELHLEIANLAPQAMLDPRLQMVDRARTRHVHNLASWSHGIRFFYKGNSKRYARNRAGSAAIIRAA
jgi:hypothetical protein